MWNHLVNQVRNRIDPWHKSHILYINLMKKRECPWYNKKKKKKHFDEQVMCFPISGGECQVETKEGSKVIDSLF